MGKVLRILLVEDSAEDAELLLRALDRAGYEPEAHRVDSEDDLRTAAAEGAWDVAICDWSLPVLSAPRAVETLHDVSFDGPIIIVSGTMGEEHVVEAMRAGADDYVVKGNLSRLAPAIERELQEAEVRATARRAEGRLAVSEARLRSLVNTIPATTYVAVASKSRTGFVTEYISPQITRMIGYTPDELVQRPDLWYDVLHPEDRDAALRMRASHLATGVPLRQEYRIVGPDGRVVWVRDEAAMLPDEDGRPGFSQGVLSDITDSKTAEETLRRQALIFENVHDAVLIVDLDGRILDVNPGAELMFGYSKEEARGRVPDFLSDVELVGDIRSSVAGVGRWTGEVPVRRKDGASRVAELVVVPLKAPDGQVLGTVGVLRDITERKRSEEELTRNWELLRDSDRERRQLVSRLVTAREEEAQRIAGEIHDDPIQKLSAVALRLGMLGKEVGDGAPAGTIAQIQKAVVDTIGRLRGMLFELSPRALEVGGLGEALKEYFQHANQEDATCYLLQDELSRELGQEKRTIAYRVLLEALSNVRKHADAQRATVHLADADGGVRCTVTDDGKGFASEEVTVSLPGHMGSASMRQRIEMAGGWIEIRSRPSRGTTVEFWLPEDQPVVDIAG